MVLRKVPSRQRRTKNNHIITLMKTIILAITMFACAVSAVSARTATVYNANDTAAVRIVGRTDRSAGDGSVRFDWSGTYMETILEGRALKMRVGDTGKSLFDIFVDGRKLGKIMVNSTDTTITVADKLPRGRHQIAIRKCTEGETGVTTVRQFILPDGGTLAAAQPRGRHIEFVGNSLSAGFGTESNNPRDPFTPESENCNLAYSTIIPRFFDADYTVIAHSGRGIVRNYGDSVRVSERAMRHKFMQTLDTDTALRWHFGDYRPDLVVINLGSNDFSTEPHPYRSEFVKAYCELIDSIKANYGKDTPILCVVPYSISSDVDDYFREIISRAVDTRIYKIRMSEDYLNWDSDRGAVWHPNYQASAKWP